MGRHLHNPVDIANSRILMGIFEVIAALFVVTILAGSLTGVDDNTSTEAEACLLCVSVKTQDQEDQVLQKALVQPPASPAPLLVEQPHLLP